MTRISLPARADDDKPEERAPARGMRAMADRAQAINERLARGRALAGGPGKVRGCYVPDPGTEQKRLEIRRAAARLAAEQGVWRLSVREVAKAMHLCAPTVAYYYANREEMIADIAAEHLARLSDAVSEALDGVSSLGPAAELDAFSVAFLCRVLEERYEHRLLIRSGDILSGQDRVMVAARWDTLADLVRSRLIAVMPGLLKRPWAGDGAGAVPDGRVEQCGAVVRSGGAGVGGGVSKDAGADGFSGGGAGGGGCGGGGEGGVRPRVPASPRASPLPGAERRDLPFNETWK